MKYADFVVQAITLVLLAVELALLGMGAEMGSVLAATVLFLFGWQILACVIELIVQTPFSNARRRYLIAVIVYALSVPGIPKLTGHLAIPGMLIAYVLYCLAGAAALTLFYFYLTWKTTLLKKKQGSFLPHLSF